MNVRWNGRKSLIEPGVVRIALGWMNLSRAIQFQKLSFSERKVKKKSGQAVFVSKWPLTKYRPIDLLKRAAR
jgi:hypothetical protein